LVCFDCVYPDGSTQKQFANKHEVIVVDRHPDCTISGVNNLPCRRKK
jgi:hypothetical protein